MRSFRWPFPRRRSYWLLGVVGVLLGARLYHRDMAGRFRLRFDSPGPYHVARVIDGYTLLLEGNVRLRLMGIGPSEANTIGADSGPAPHGVTEFVRTQVEGRDVTLEFDRERKDTQGQVLAYVYHDQSMLNEQLIRLGYARVVGGSQLDRTVATKFRNAEREARLARRGIWAVAATNRR